MTEASESPAPRWCLPAVVLAAAVGLGLLVDTARSISTTYDEVTYLEVANLWWKTGQQDQITRMGSPLTYWKVQIVPTLWLLEHAGYKALTDRPLERQAGLLPALRIAALWVWLVAFGLTALWARRLYGPRAMAFAAWLFALSPNLLAHGSLVTMELPLVACTTAIFYLFWRFLRGGAWRDFWAGAVVCGLAFSCKFTAAVVPAMLGLVWWIDLVGRGGVRPARAAWRVTRWMAGFVAVLAATDLVITGFALLPLSPTPGADHPSLVGLSGGREWLRRLLVRVIETPIPQDLVGFLAQIQHQRTGGPSYLLGERRMTGWWYYYLVALAVKAPLAFGVLAAARVALGRRAGGAGRAWVLPVWVAAFLVVTSLGSTRNYGVRYLLPLSPLAVVWVSALAERRGWPCVIAWLGIAGQAAAVASVHPNELTFFNALAGGPVGGRRVLADSNLDWGQGLMSLARLQREHPEFRDLTFYYFGDTHPYAYGIAGRCYVVDAMNVRKLPPELTARTRYLAVSASLRWGPWGPPGYFRPLERVRPVRLTDDTTIAVYRTADVLGR